jgi:hypothetical protein
MCEGFAVRGSQFAVRHPGSASSRVGNVGGKLSDLSRRDNRTQPGVLTPGTDRKGGPPCKGGRLGILGGGIEEMRYRVLLTTFSFAPSGQPPFFDLYQGVKPRESCSPFGTKPSVTSFRKIDSTLGQCRVTDCAVEPRFPKANHESPPLLQHSATPLLR